MLNMHQHKICFYFFIFVYNESQWNQMMVRPQHSWIYILCSSEESKLQRCRTWINNDRISIFPSGLGDLFKNCVKHVVWRLLYTSLNILFNWNKVQNILLFYTSHNQRDTSTSHQTWKREGVHRDAGMCFGICMCGCVIMKMTRAVRAWRSMKDFLMLMLPWRLLL